MPIGVKRPDVIQRQQPDAVQLKGLIGERLEACRVNRLRRQEEFHLLWPFQEHCPVGFGHPDAPHPEITRGDWQGEFMGTWLDTACLSAWNAGDGALRQKIDGMVRDWLVTQQEDGYLGPYDEKDRWKSWDVWTQAHDIIGLMAYYRYTGSEAALNAAVRVADRVLQDFGPGKRHLYPTGPHGGMASSAFIEPLMWLYWQTGNEDYLKWGRWLVDEDWEHPEGPKISSSLMAGRGVAATANAKAAEMLICFAGMLELYRATGEERYLRPALLAWDDILRHHLYITGSASTGECFQADYVLRNEGQFHLGETCVTMTWLYLNLSLGRLTREPRFFDAVEQALYNHLLAAQSPDGRGWAYYVGLRDSKRYRWHTDPDCCPQRGSRALAHMVQHVCGVTDDGVVVNFYEPCEASLALPQGSEIRLTVEGNYPFDGHVGVKLDLEEATRFKVSLRVPGWCQAWSLSLNGASQDTTLDDNGWLVLDREWVMGDRIELNLDMPVRVTVDGLGNNGRVALMRGPVVYAADGAFLPHKSRGAQMVWDGQNQEPIAVGVERLGIRLLDDVVLALPKAKPATGVHVVYPEDGGPPRLRVPAVVLNPDKGVGVWGQKGRYFDLSGCRREADLVDIELVPFFAAGNGVPGSYKDGVWPNTEAGKDITYQVWLPYFCLQED